MNIDRDKLFLVPNLNLQLFTTKNKIYLCLDERTKGGIINFSQINNTSLIIISAIDGVSTYDEVVKKSLKVLKLSEKYRVVIDKFIEKLLEKNFIFSSKNKGNKISIPQKHSEVDYFLTHATVELTNKCNLMCKHCYMSASNKNNDMISYEKFKYISDILVKEGVYNIELTGGEVFENVEFEKILEYALNNFNIVGVLTNGTKDISDNILNMLVKHKERVIVSISIDSVNSVLHDNFRGKIGSWEKSIFNIQKLVNSGIKVRLASSIFKDNMWEIDKLANLSRELGVSVFSYNFVEEFGRGKNFNKKQGVEKDIEYQSYIKSIIDEYKDVIQIVESDAYERSTGNCGAGTSSITIDAKGSIRPCVLASSNFKIGKIYCEPFIDKNVINKLVNLKAPSLENGCVKGCKFFYKCRGCYVRALNINKEQRMECNWLKLNHAEGFLNYL